MQRLQDLFVNRTDCYCVQTRQGYAKIDQPLTNEVLEKHLSGKITAGSYQLDANNKVKWLAFDFDPEKLENPKEAVQKILNVLFERKQEPDGIVRPRVWPKSVLLEASRFPDQSYHVWLFFEPVVYAKVAQWLGLRILELAGLDPRLVEVFPKQTEVTEDRPYGNFVKLPLGRHQLTNKWSRFLGFEGFEPLPNDCLLNAQGATFSDSDLTKIESFGSKSHVQATFELPKELKPLSNYEEEKAVNFLCKYWKAGARNRLEMFFLGLCLKKGVSYESAKCIISEVADRTSDPERQARLDLVDYHYRNRVKVSLKAVSGLREIMREMQ